MIKNNVDLKIGQIYEIQIVRPECGNKINNEIMSQVIEDLNKASSDDNCRAVIFSTAGLEYFCVGATQISDVVKASPRDVIEFGDKFIEFHTAFMKCTKPIICAVEGEAIGAGFCIIDACDLAICSETSLISISEILMGNCPAMGVSGVIEHLPKKLFMECGLLGKKLTSGEALKYCVVNRVVKQGTVVETARILANRFIDLNPTGIALFKKMAKQMNRYSYEQNIEIAESLLVSMFKSNDGIEVQNSRIENRRPIFHGN